MPELATSLMFNFIVVNGEIIKYFYFGCNREEEANWRYQGFLFDVTPPVKKRSLQQAVTMATKAAH